MQKIKELIREVYHYEKKSEIETRYLSNVLLWFCLMVFLINLFNNGMKKNPGIYIFCLVVCVIGVWDAFHIRNAKNVELPVKVVTILLLVSSVYCIYFGGNDGFQNLWFFIAPSDSSAAGRTAVRCAVLCGLWRCHYGSVLEHAV